MKNEIKKQTVFMNELKLNGIKSLMFDMIHLATLDYLNGKIALYNNKFKTEYDKRICLAETIDAKNYILNQAIAYADMDGQYIIEKCDKQFDQLRQQAEM